MKEVTYKTKDLYICHLRVIESNSFKCYTKHGLAICKRNLRGQYINVLTGEKYWNHIVAVKEGIIGEIFVRGVEHFPEDIIQEHPTLTKAEVESCFAEINDLETDKDNGVNLN